MGANEGRRRTAAPDVLRLTVRVDGAPSPGHVGWVTSPSPTWAFSQMGRPAYGSERTDRIRTAAHGGRAEIEVPSGHWVWLRVDAAGRAAYARVAPFSGVRDRTFDLDSARRTIHVQAYAPDYRTPAGGQAVTVFGGPIGAGGATVGAGSGAGDPRRVRRVATDAFGYASVNGLPPGAYSVCAPGAEPEDGFPYAVRLVLPEGLGPSEHPCVVVTKPPTRTVRVRVHASFQSSSARAPKLFLKRKDDGSGTLHPCTGVLRPGTYDMEWEVPDGTYLIGGLPLGELRVRPELLVVSPEARPAAVHVTGSTEWTELHLVGVGRHQLPVRVVPQAVDSILDDRPGLMFLGRPRWPAASLRVPSQAGPCRIAAVGRSHTFLSAEPVWVRGEMVRVPMEAATYLRVEWYSWVPDRDVGGILAIDGTRGSFARSLTPEVVPRGGTHRAALVGELVVPRGPMLLTYLRHDGVEAWTRPMITERNWQIVRVGESDP